MRNAARLALDVRGSLSGSAGRRLRSSRSTRASASAGITLCAADNSSTALRSETGERSSLSISLAPTNTMSPGRGTR